MNKGTLKINLIFFKLNPFYKQNGFNIKNILMLNPSLKYVVSVYFLPLFIMAKTATIKITTTRANRPIIQIPFSHTTKGIFRVFKMYWFLF